MLVLSLAVSLCPSHHNRRKKDGFSQNQCLHVVFLNEETTDLKLQPRLGFLLAFGTQLMMVHTK